MYCISRLRFSDISGVAEVDEQRVCSKFCVRLGKTGSETFEMLKQAFGDLCISCSRTFEWFGRFKNGRTSTANDDRSGWPSTATTPSKVEQVQAAVNQDRRHTIHDLCAEVGIGYGSCQLGTFGYTLVYVCSEVMFLMLPRQGTTPQILKLEFLMQTWGPKEKRK